VAPPKTSIIRRKGRETHIFWGKANIFTPKRKVPKDVYSVWAGGKADGTSASTRLRKLPEDRRKGEPESVKHAALSYHKGKKREVVHIERGGSQLRH